MVRHQYCGDFVFGFIIAGESFVIIWSQIYGRWYQGRIRGAGDWGDRPPA